MWTVWTVIYILVGWGICFAGFVAGVQTERRRVTRILDHVEGVGSERVD